MNDRITIGVRIALNCPLGETYYSGIYECVPNAIASNPQFLLAYATVSPCNGGIVDTAAALETLRFCQIVLSPIELTVNDSNADYSALYDIQRVTGRSEFLRSIILNCFFRLSRHSREQYFDSFLSGTFSRSDQVNKGICHFDHRSV